MNTEKIKLEAQQEQLDIPVIISRFIESMAENHKIDGKYIMISYNKIDGTLDVWNVTSGKPSILLQQIYVNDL